MSAGVEVLYRGVLVEHARHPHNRRVLADATASAEIENPLCGDRVTVYVTGADGVVRDVSFVGDACAVATASASMMTDAVRGKSLDEGRRLFGAFEQFLRTGCGVLAGVDLGALAAFAGVREFPSRLRCALLPWQALFAAVSGDAPPHD